MFDVIVIGGSFAGLSAAMALGRSLRKVLIIDSEIRYPFELLSSSFRKGTYTWTVVP